MKNYSDNEIALFEDLGYFKGISCENFDPVPLYRMAAVKAFLCDDRRPCVDRLRKACQAIENCSPYRQTKEFDDLIKRS